MKGFRNFWRRNIRADVEDELTFHLEASITELVQGGMSRDDAEREARRRFGSVEGARERCETIDHLHERDKRRADFFESLKQDVRYAIRSLARTPGFTAVVVLTLALGICANTAMFSVVNAVLLKPLPYKDPHQLVRVFSSFRGSGNLQYPASQPEFMDYKSLSNVFENAAAYTAASLTLTGDGEPQRLRGLNVTRDFFPVLGMVPAAGRLFEGDDGRAGTEPKIIVTDAFWRAKFGADPSLLGRTLPINGIMRRVVAILPPDASFAGAEVFIPAYINPDSMSGRSSNFLNVVARLRPGISVDKAQGEANTLTKTLNERFPVNYPSSMGFGARVISLRNDTVGSAEPALLILLGSVALVLLIACANVANLLLARGEARQREIAVRLALGAGRRRVITQLLTESTLLALVGAAVGSAFAWWGTRAIVAMSAGAIPRAEGIRIDMTVGLVTLALAVVTGILFGLAPALQLARGDVQATLRDGARGGSEGRSRHRFGKVLVAAEMALAVVVVIGAALLVRSFTILQRVDPGFDARNLLTVDLSLPAARYDGAAAISFYQQLIDRAGAMPGVRVAAAATALPPNAPGNNLDIFIDGRATPPGGTLPSPNFVVVTRRYFEALGIRPVQGRAFSDVDAPTSEPVAVINETTARRVWPEGNAIGQRVRTSQRRPWMTIVGIVPDVHSNGLDQPAPAELYVMHEQRLATAGGAERSLFLVLRTATDPMAVANGARTAVKEIDPLLAITGVRSMTEIMERSVARPRFAMRLLTAFGALALVLAAIGIYGIMAYGVKRRTREIGIRMALGAQRSSVLALIVRQGMALAAAGLMAGTLGALFITRYMTALLYGVQPFDAITFGAVVVVLGGVALLASWIPARRAVSANAVEALRE